LALVNRDKDLQHFRINKRWQSPLNSDIEQSNDSVYCAFDVEEMWEYLDGNSIKEISKAIEIKKEDPSATFPLRKTSKGKLAKEHRKKRKERRVPQKSRGRNLKKVKESIQK